MLQGHMHTSWLRRISGRWWIWSRKLMRSRAMELCFIGHCEIHPWDIYLRTTWIPCSVSFETRHNIEGSADSEMEIRLDAARISGKNRFVTSPQMTKKHAERWVVVSLAGEYIPWCYWGWYVMKVIILLSTIDTDELVSQTFIHVRTSPFYPKNNGTKKLDSLKTSTVISYRAT